MAYKNGDMVIITSGKGIDAVKSLAIIDENGDYICLDSYRDERFTNTLISSKDEIFKDCKIFPLRKLDVNAAANYR